MYNVEQNKEDWLKESVKLNRLNRFFYSTNPKVGNCQSSFFDPHYIHL